MKKSFQYKYLILILIIIIAAFLRLYQINQFPPGLYPDEAMNGNNALEALSSPNLWESILTFGNSGEGFKVFYPENNGREGLFINLQAISILVFGNVSQALRAVSAIFGILTVLGIYFLAKQLFDGQKSKMEREEESSDDKKTGASLFLISYPEKIALLSSFLIAVSFWHINFSRIGFRAIMSPFFLVWALYLLLLSSKKILGGQKFLKFGVAAGIIYGLGFYSYIAYRATPLLIIIIFLYFWFKNKDSVLRKNLYKLFFVFVAATIIVFLPLGIYFALNPQDFLGRTSQISVFSAEGEPASGENSLLLIAEKLSKNILQTAAMFNFRGDGNWRHNFSERPELFWPVGIMFLTGTICAVSHLCGKGKFAGKKINPKLKQNLPPPPINPPTPEHPITTFDNFPLEEKKLEPPPLKPLEKACGPITSKFPFIVIFSWLIIAALPIVISNEGLPHALRAIIMIPPIFMLAGFGGIQFFENIIKKIFKSSHLQKTVAVIILAFLLIEGYYTYFVKWGKNENVLGAFAQNYVDLGEELNLLPKELPKYVVVKAGGVDVRGIPMPAQTIMFITDTFTPEKQKEKNIFYVLPPQENQIPLDAHKTILE